MKIVLVRKDNTSETLEVDRSKVEEATIVVYDGRFYTYSAKQAPFFAASARFEEVNPPVVLA